MTQSYRVVVENLGYRRLDPLPAEDALCAFYQSEYFHLIKQGGRAPELRRLMEGKGNAQRESEWLEATLWDDVSHLIETWAPGRRVLEVGCGVGSMLEFLARAGLEVQGVEPSKEAVELAREHGIPVHHGDLSDYVSAHHGNSFDAVVLTNVLEHVPHPLEMLREVRGLLAPNGVTIIRVPNDFTPLQDAARRKIGSPPPWWLAIPDHINYFNFDSLHRALTHEGYEVCQTLSDFPMELFLLLGMDYVGDKSLGDECHQRRVEFELSVSPQLRRELYGALSAAGVGRNVTMVGRRLAPRVDMEAFQRSSGSWQFVGLRQRDLEDLRRFRNAQMDVLRQKEVLTAAHQERWWWEVAQPTHRSPTPKFLLVSILHDGQFVGYGGCTHLDWDNGRGEVSFLVDPARAADTNIYRKDMLAFLQFLKEWAFEELGLRRLFTETYNFRVDHMRHLEEAGFVREGVLKSHVTNPHGEGWVDSVIHGVVAGVRRI